MVGLGFKTSLTLKSTSSKLKTELLYDPAIPLLGIYSEKTWFKGFMQPNAHCNTVTIAKTWKQPKYPSREE